MVFVNFHSLAGALHLKHVFFCFFFSFVLFKKKMILFNLHVCNQFAKTRWVCYNLKTARLTVSSPRLSGRCHMQPLAGLLPFNTSIIGPETWQDKRCHHKRVEVLLLVFVVVSEARGALVKGLNTPTIIKTTGVDLAQCPVLILDLLWTG